MNDKTDDLAKDMSLRDWFVGKVITGLLAGYWSNNQIAGCTPSQLADMAYKQADALLAAREETKEK